MRFVEMQRLPTRGNHDIEPMRIGPHSLLAIANQGDGVTCNSSVDILYYTFKRFAPLQSLDVGCATYAHSGRAAASSWRWPSSAWATTRRTRRRTTRSRTCTSGCPIDQMR